MYLILKIMKKILFILIFILFNNVVVFWNIEESKTATWELIKTVAKQISTEELNKNIKKAEIEQLEEIIKNDSNLEKKLIWEFKKSNLSLNNFLENYYLNKNKVTEIEKDEKYNKKNIWKEIEVNKITEKNNLQINNEKKENILYNSFLKYLPLLNLILIIIFLFHYLFNKKN